MTTILTLALQLLAAPADIGRVPAKAILALARNPRSIGLLTAIEAAKLRKHTAALAVAVRANDWARRENVVVKLLDALLVIRKASEARLEQLRYLRTRHAQQVAREAQASAPAFEQLSVREQAEYLDAEYYEMLACSR